jgi:acetyl esterase/lipase
MKRKSLIITALLISSIGFITSAQTVYPLYKGEIPNALPNTVKEAVEVSTRGTSSLSKVTVPTIKVYLPERNKATGTAVVICPGGGYVHLAITHEGEQVAEEYQKIGVAAIVLKYRLPSDETMKDKSIGPLQDAQQAIKMVREHAGEWNIDPAKVGILGFSAGGHLASTAGTHFNTSLIPNPANVNLRPDFMVLIYPVISFSDSLTHMGSRNNLVGKTPTAKQIENYSNEVQVTSATPPTFLVHAGDDKGVTVKNSLVFYNALLKNAVPAGLIIYPKGGHGFGLVNATTPDKWFIHNVNWLVSQNFLPAQSK